MKKIWTQKNIINFIKQFGVGCYYYQARLSPEQKNGIIKLNNTAIMGFHYEPPVSVRLMRTSISYRIITSDMGRLYEGGARFTIPPIARENGQIVSLPIYERIFRGDVIAVKTKPVRDYDLLTKGQRDKLYAFDVKSLLSISSIDTAGNETRYVYDEHYTLQINGVTANAVVDSNGIVTISPQEDIPIVSDVLISWRPGALQPADGQPYTVEFTCSPNYIVWDELAKPRASEESDLPKMAMCVKRAYITKQDPNPIDSVPTQASILTSGEMFSDEDNY
jgi:hypothetical protein